MIVVETGGKLWWPSIKNDDGLKRQMVNGLKMDESLKLRKHDTRKMNGVEPTNRSVTPT